MKLAIMQPYFFPYIGYWQLMTAVDCFVIYDDVSYIKGGWINRNRVLINGSPSYITLPLESSSSNKFISEITILENPRWRHKLLKKIAITYSRTPHFKVVFPVIESILMNPTNSLSEFLVHHLQSLTLFMEIDIKFVVSSCKYDNSKLNGQERILEICKHENASTYINLPGGQGLYNKSDFQNNGIELKFLIPKQFVYKQQSSDFHEFLSIVDGLMSVGPFEIRRHLKSFNFI